MRLTAAGLFGIFTRFPFDRLRLFKKRRLWRTIANDKGRYFFDFSIFFSSLPGNLPTVLGGRIELFFF